MRVCALVRSPAKAGIQPVTNAARGSVRIGAPRRVWTPAPSTARLRQALRTGLAGEQGDIE